MNGASGHQSLAKVPKGSSTYPFLERRRSEADWQKFTPSGPSASDPLRSFGFVVASTLRRSRRQVDVDSLAQASARLPEGSGIRVSSRADAVPMAADTQNAAPNPDQSTIPPARTFDRAIAMPWTVATAPETRL